MRMRWVTIGVTVASLGRRVPRLAVRAAPVLSGLRPARARGRSHACRRTPRSTPVRPSPASSMPSSRPIPTSSAGAPMSAAARSASTCRSTSSCPTTSSPRPSSWQRISRRAIAFRPSSKLMSSRCRASWVAFRRSSWGHPSAGRCSTGVSGPDLSQVRSIALRGSPKSSAAIPTSREVSFDWMEPARQVPGHDRPGQGAAAGAGARGRSPRSLNTLMARHRRHTGPRRHLSHPRRHARARRAAQLAVDAARPAGCRWRTAAPCR